MSHNYRKELTAKTRRYLYNPPTNTPVKSAPLNRLYISLTSINAPHVEAESTSEMSKACFYRAINVPLRNQDDYDLDVMNQLSECRIFDGDKPTADTGKSFNAITSTSGTSRAMESYSL